MDPKDKIRAEVLLKRAARKIAKKLESAAGKAALDAEEAGNAEQRTAAAPLPAGNCYKRLRPLKLVLSTSLRSKGGDFPESKDGLVPEGTLTDGGSSDGVNSDDCDSDEYMRGAELYLESRKKKKGVFLDSSRGGGRGTPALVPLSDAELMKIRTNLAQSPNIPTKRDKFATFMKHTFKLEDEEAVEAFWAEQQVRAVPHPGAPWTAFDTQLTTQYSKGRTSLEQTKAPRGVVRLVNALVQFLVKAGRPMQLSDLFNTFFAKHPELKKFKPTKATTFIQWHSRIFEMKALEHGQHQISLSVASRAAGGNTDTITALVSGGGGSSGGGGGSKQAAAAAAAAADAFFRVNPKSGISLVRISMF